MIRHCVMFTWNEDVDELVKTQVAAGLDRLALLPGVVAYLHGPDAGLAEGNWDYVVTGDFVDADAYRGYSTDTGHLELIETLIRPNISARAAIQFSL